MMRYTTVDIKDADDSFKNAYEFLSLDADDQQVKSSRVPKLILANIRKLFVLEEIESRFSMLILA